MAERRTTGNKISPWRFTLFFAVLAIGWTAGILVTSWSTGLLAGFDIAALVFMASCANTLAYDSKRLRAVAAQNDANQIVLLVLSFLISVVILAAVVAELANREALTAWIKALIAVSLILVWSFGNAVYTLQYCHLFYTADDGGKDAAGLKFPGTAEPRMSDFAYFSYTLGVAVQTSDVQVTSPHIRNVVTVHCVAGFFFNLGVLALTINVLGSG